MADEIVLLPDGGYRVHQETHHFDGEKGCYTIWSVRDSAGAIVHSYQGDAFAETGARTLCEQLNVAWAAGRKAALLPADARERVATELHAQSGCPCGDRVLHKGAWLGQADAVLAALAKGNA